MALPNNVFTGYSPTQLRKLAQSYGYNETNLDNFGKFLEENPSRAKQYFDQQNMDMFGPDKMRQFQQGGTTNNTATDDLLENREKYKIDAPKIAEITAQRVTQPQLPIGGAFQAVATPFQQAQLLNPAVGQLGPAPQIPTAAQVSPALAIAPTAPDTPTTVTAATTAPAIQALPGTAQTIAAPTQTIEAAQQAQSQLENLQAAQAAQAAQVQAPTARTLQAGEQIALPTGQAAQAATFVAPTAVTAAPTEAATVQGQLTTLLQQFEAGEVPTWAKGAVRAAQQTLLTRGLGASSIAGQAVVQAAMEAALPIAQMDAATVAKFEAQNLSNRQQAAMVSAQYRASFMQQEFDQAFQTRVQNAAKIADIANRNFTADQQIALENSKFVQTTNLANLSNEQALVLAQAGALAQLDIANLNNRQQSAVQNAQNFLQLDMKNLTNRQQSAILSSQQQVQGLLTDTAAENVARQINAKSQQQSDEFYAGLTAGISQQNAMQVNAMNQFNAGQVNSLQKYHSDLINQRQQFNAKNQLAIEQSNALWRREIATADTAAMNFQNQTNAQNILNMSNLAYNNLWQEYRDVMEWTWTSSESDLERFHNMEVAQLQASRDMDLVKYKARKNDIVGIGNWLGGLLGIYLDNKQ